MSSSASTEHIVEQPAPQARWLSAWDVVSVVAIVVGIALRWRNLGEESFWFDEGLTGWMIGLTPGEIVRMCRADVAAPLYFIALRCWSFVFGTSEAALRGMSALFASMSLVLLYLLARRILKNPLAACVATWFFALSTFQIQFALEARFYAMLCFLCLGAIYCAHVFLGSRSQASFAGIVLFSAAALYTHNAAMFYLMALHAFWILIPAPIPWRQRILWLVLADVCIGIVYLPWFPTVIEQARWAATHFWASKPYRWDLMYVLCFLAGGKPYALGSYWNLFEQTTEAKDRVIEVYVVALGAVLILAALIRRPRETLALGAYGLLPVLVVFFQSRLSRPIWMDRVFIASSVIPPLLWAMPLTRKLHWSLRSVHTLLLLPMLGLSILTIYCFDRFEQKEGWRWAYEYVSDQERKGTLVVFCAPEAELPFNYYASLEQPPKPAFARTGTPGGFFEIDPPRTVRQVKEDADIEPLKKILKSGKYRQVILVLSHEWWADPENRTMYYLDSTCSYLDSAEWNSIHVYRYRVIGPAATPPP